MVKSTLIRGLVIACLFIAVVSPLTVTTAQEAPPGGCPPDFVPRPPELNPALGPCVPGAIANHSILRPLLDTDPNTCPPGWVRAVPPLNPALGCLPAAAGGPP
jgi:hypothetical protein